MLQSGEDLLSHDKKELTKTVSTCCNCGAYSAGDTFSTGCILLYIINGIYCRAIGTDIERSANTSLRILRVSNNNIKQFCLVQKQI